MAAPRCILVFSNVFKLDPVSPGGDDGFRKIIKSVEVGSPVEARQEALLHWFGSRAPTTFVDDSGDECVRFALEGCTDLRMVTAALPSSDVLLSGNVFGIAVDTEAEGDSAGIAALEVVAVWPDPGQTAVAVTLSAPAPDGSAGEYSLAVSSVPDFNAEVDELHNARGPYGSLVFDPHAANGLKDTLREKLALFVTSNLASKADSDDGQIRAIFIRG